MSWIVFIKEGNENKIPGKPDHFINFKKRSEFKLQVVCVSVAGRECSLCSVAGREHSLCFSSRQGA